MPSSKINKALDRLNVRLKQLKRIFETSKDEKERNEASIRLNELSLAIKSVVLRSRDLPPSDKTRMCDSKRRYLTIIEANATANQFNSRVYKCPYCQFWHITSKKA